MKKELEKKIKAMCDSIGTVAAEEMRVELTEDLGEEFDRRVKAGMSELDAYRDVLKNIDEIQKLLDSLPVTDEELDRMECEREAKKWNRIISKISSCCWLALVIVYFLFSIASGMWHLTWLMFLWGAIGQILLNMVTKYNKGRTMKKVLSGGLSGILWLSTVMMYFVFSFASGMWHLTWLMYIAATIVQIILSAILDNLLEE